MSSHEAATSKDTGLGFDAFARHALEVQVDQARILLRGVPLGVAGGLATTATLAWILRAALAVPAMWVWWTASVLAHGALLTAWLTARPQSDQPRQARRCLLILRACFLALGSAWALLPTAFASSTPFNQLLGSMILAAIIGAGVAQIAADTWAAALYMLPPAIAATVPLFMSTDSTLRAMGPLGLLYFGFLFVATLRIQASYVELSRMRSLAAGQSQCDALTGLPNRLALLTHLRAALARARRSHREVVVAYLDLDDFKRVNDLFGHAAGDRLLVEVASRWRSQLRESELMARLGGDEFVLVIEGIAPGQAASQLAPAAERLQHALATPIDVGNDASAPIGMTMGAARYPVDGDDPVALLQQADAAMYELKQHKDTRVHWWKLQAQDHAPATAAARVLAS